jgi:hypothetical protein
MVVLLASRSNRLAPAWLTALVEQGVSGSVPLTPLPSGHIHLSAASIEQQVQALTCFFPATADTRPADDLYIDVAQVVPFDGLVRRTRQIPAQRRYVEAYWRVNASPISRLPRAVRYALACRIARAWASYVSELHFASLVIESGRWATYFRSLVDDAHKGVDLQLRDACGHDGAVALYVSSPAGWSYRQRKHRAPSAMPIFKVPLRLDEAHRMGPIHLYRAEDVQHLWGSWVDYEWPG